MGSVLEELTAIRTVAERTGAFHDEARCPRLVEAMVWPNGRLCPSCGSRRSITLAERVLEATVDPDAHLMSDE